MPLLHWSGGKARPLLATAVTRAGWSFTPQLQAAHARVVQSLSLDGLPDGRGSIPYLWLCPRRLAEGAAAQAVLRGAYDVVWAGATDAPSRLTARLLELAVEEPTIEADPLVISQSAAARRLLAQVVRAARTSMPVLLTGETGTGKELAARLVHRRSARASRPFVPINCAAIPNELMEAELFGYAKGAFSGATRTFDGQLVAAAGGTVFLDEIDDTPLSTQIKLLRVLEDRVVTRLGESNPHHVDFRIIAATNRDLRGLIAKGAFGRDFYERLAIVSIRLAPMRERLEDLEPMTRHFIERFYREEPEAAPRASRVVAVSAEALAALSAYPWPGNIRELRNVIFEALVYKRRGTELLLSDLPRRVLHRPASSEDDALYDRVQLKDRIERGRLNLRGELEALEKAALTLALEHSGGNAARAARLLGQVGRGRARDPGGTVRAMMRRLR